MSAYWPGLNSKVAGSTACSRSDTMSRVTGCDRGHRGADVLDGHAAEQLVLVEVQQLDRAVAERM